MDGPKIQIELIDAGAPPELVAQQPGPPARRASSSDSSDQASTVGPRKSAQSAATLDTLTTAAGKLSNTLGAGGLFNVSKDLVESFRELYSAVTAATGGIERQETASASGSSAARGPAKSTTAPSGAGSPESPPIAAKTPLPPIPKVGTFERQVAKSAVAGPPVSRAVAGPVPNVGWFERTAAQGAVEAPPIAAANVAMDAEIVGPAASEAAAGLAGLEAAAGPLGIAFAAVTAGVMAGGYAVKKFSDGLHREADKLTGLSGPLASAQARNDMRMEFAMMRRAGSVGPNLARFENIRGGVNEKLADIGTSLLTIVGEFIQTAEPQLKDAVNALGVVEAQIAKLAATVEITLDTLGGRNAEVLEDVQHWVAASVRLNKSIDAWLNRGSEEKDGGDDPYMTAFLGQFPNGKRPPARARGAGGAGP